MANDLYRYKIVLQIQNPHGIMICQRSHCHDKHAKPCRTTLSGDPQQSADTMRLCNGVTRHISTSAFLRINKIKINQKVTMVAVVYTRLFRLQERWFVGKRKFVRSLYSVQSTPKAILSLIS